jgi:hypothetical protein
MRPRLMWLILLSHHTFAEHCIILGLRGGPVKVEKMGIGFAGVMATKALQRWQQQRLFRRS